MNSNERHEHASSAGAASTSGLSVDRPKVSDYNRFAEACPAENETNLINAYYERPAMLALAGEAAGRRVLDAGCGSGPLSAALRDRGAVVSGLDASAGMLEPARRRPGGGADPRVADLGSALPYPDDTFDDVVASLGLHYLEDWGPALTELRRVLRPGGRLIASVDHPFAVNLMHRLAGREDEYDYFDTTNWTAEWTMGGQTALTSIWHRPLHAMIEAFAEAGFRITVISEPEPDPAARERFPEAIADKPRFLCSCSSSSRPTGQCPRSWSRSGRGGVGHCSRSTRPEPLRLGTPAGPFRAWGPGRASRFSP